jgi:hypothetical protein
MGTDFEFLVRAEFYFPLDEPFSGVARHKQCLQKAFQQPLVIVALCAGMNQHYAWIAMGRKPSVIHEVRIMRQDDALVGPRYRKHILVTVANKPTLRAAYFALKPRSRRIFATPSPMLSSTKKRAFPANCLFMSRRSAAVGCSSAFHTMTINPHNKKWLLTRIIS